MRTPKSARSLWQKLPLLIWLVIVWGALWRDFSAGNLIFGAVIAIIVSQLFYLPPIELSGRFNPLRAVGMMLWFIGQVTVASFQVLYWAVVKGPRIRNAVVAVPLRSPSDLLMTAVGHVLSLIPGSLVVEVDRGRATLYVHAMNVQTPAGAAKVRSDVQGFEARLIQVMGTREELAALNAERAGGPMVSHADRLDAGTYVPRESSGAAGAGAGNNAGEKP
ncbi:multicomponent Na+:H+ antiporter subunit E [Arthrobacter stackebrandtii]|uniref:Multicomponent Na+:H+ antiporter subunit E n=1 Tax=Arthrobacter stackebrandtii TaxID=272161 RepID=A0ABS4YUU1_9MICC|nr:multicomponent Na+:H+ antiporter subunit E [Arthrobacter stackebrandtii]